MSSCIIHAAIEGLWATFISVLIQISKNVSVKISLISSDFTICFVDRSIPIVVGLIVITIKINTIIDADILFFILCITPLFCTSH